MGSQLRRGYPAVTAIAWYLDEIVHSDRFFERFYHANDQNLDLARQYPKLALGGESAMWGELVSARGGRDMYVIEIIVTHGSILIWGSYQLDVAFVCRHWRALVGKRPCSYS